MYIKYELHNNIMIYIYVYYLCRKWTDIGKLKWEMISNYEHIVLLLYIAGYNILL